MKRYCHYVKDVDDAIWVHVCLQVPSWIKRLSAEGYSNSDYVKDIDQFVTIHIAEQLNLDTSVSHSVVGCIGLCRNSACLSPDCMIDIEFYVRCVPVEH